MSDKEQNEQRERPFLAGNHNETLVRSYVVNNHNLTLVRSAYTLNHNETVAQIAMNHNETLAQNEPSDERRDLDVPEKQADAVRGGFGVSEALAVGVKLATQAVDHALGKRPAKHN